MGLDPARVRCRSCRRAARCRGEHLDVAEREGRRGAGPAPRAPDGSPFQEFFNDFFNKQKGKQGGNHNVSSLGSGFVIDPQGYIVTNNHVIEGADDIEVNFADGSKLKAKLIGTDTKTDLSVLKVEPKAPLKFVKFGDSSGMRIGDWVMAIGNPFGFGGSVTVGIISGRGRNINAGPYDNFIQTDAAINKGNSGGPALQHEGRGDRHQHGDHFAERRFDRHRLLRSFGARSRRR
jgi:serine protease Do